MLQLYDQLLLLFGLFEFPFPGIDGHDSGNQRDARRKAPTDEAMGELIGDLLLGGGDKNNAQLFICHGPDSPGTRFIASRWDSAGIISAPRGHSGGREIAIL